MRQSSQAPRSYLHRVEGVSFFVEARGGVEVRILDVELLAGSHHAAAVCEEGGAVKWGW